MAAPAPDRRVMRVDAPGVGPPIPPHSALVRPRQPSSRAARGSRSHRSNVFYRKLNRRYPRIVRGEGCWLFDAEGRRYLDGSGGAFVANLGHGVPEIAAAMAEQAGRIGYLNGTAFTHEPVEQLGAEIAGADAGGLDLVYPLCSGSEAVEAALKLARQYWVESGRPAKRKIVALAPSYHGNTLLALSASGRPHYQTTSAIGWSRSSGCRRLTRTAASATAQRPSARLQRRGARGRAARGRAGHRGRLHRGAGRRLIDRGVGSAAGVLAPSPGDLRPPRGALGGRRGADRRGPDRHLVRAGAVRGGAGHRHAGEGHRRRLRSALGGGGAPPARGGPGRRARADCMHAQTFSHHPVLCAAGVATIKYLREHRLIERCADDGPRPARQAGGARGSIRWWVTCAAAGSWPAWSSWRTGEPGAVPAVGRGVAER